MRFSGELFDKILELNNLTEMVASEVVKNLLDALVFMHQCGVAHRDIKAENIMLKHPAVEVPVCV